MKKIIFIFGAMALLTACPQINKEDQDSQSDPMTPDEVKERLELVAQDLMDEYPAETFEDFIELSSLFAEKYFDYDYDWDDFYEYCEEKGEGMYKFTENEWYEDGTDYYEYTDEILIMLSDIQGKLTLGENSAKCSDYDGLKVIFTLNGNDYEADVTFSGKKTTAYYSFTNVYGDNDPYYGNPYHNEGTYKIKVEVPEKVTIKVTENGKLFADVTIGFIASFTQSGVSLTKDCFLVNTTIKIDGHEFVISNTGYNASIGKATAGAEIKKGSKSIFKMELSGDVDVKLVTDEYVSDDGYYDSDVYPEFTKAKNAKISVDILGQMQVKGSCNNILTLSDYMDNLWEANDKSTAERAVDNINNQLDLGLYYDGSSTKQADIIMDYYVVEDDYYGDEWYDIEPIIVFNDGSKYAFYEYFDEDDFDGTIDHFELWIEMYETMLEHYFD